MDGRFEAYVPLHHLWLGYVSELLGLGPRPAGTVTEQSAAMPNVATMHAKLIKADFHGSIMTGECWSNNWLRFLGLTGNGQSGKAQIRASSDCLASSSTSLRTGSGS